MKEYLSRQSIPFREVDVSRDSVGAAEMVRISGQRGVPVTVVDGEFVVGYNRPRLEQLLARVRRPRLGAAVADAAEMAAKRRCTMTQGAYVGKVKPNSVASRAGLRAGDVIIAFANRRVTSALALERLIAGTQRGKSVSLTYVRGDEQHSTQLVL